MNSTRAGRPDELCTGAAGIPAEPVIRLKKSRLFRAGFLVGAEVDHRGDLADQFDLQAALSRVQDDALDQAAQDLQRLGARLGFRER